MYSTAIRSRQDRVYASAVARTNLSWIERGLLAIGICEIPLGMDKFFLYSEEDALYGAVGGLNVSISTFAFIGLYILWMLSIINKQFSTRRVVLGIPMILYLLTVAFSVLSAERQMLAISDLFLLLQAFAFFFYIANRITNHRDLVFCIGCLALAMFMQGGIMIIQRVLGESLYGQRIYIGPTSFSVWADGRTAGTLVSAVLAGSWMAILWLVVVSLFLIIKDKQIWWFLCVCLLVGLLGMLFTQTRGAVISVLFGSLVLGVCMLIRGWLPRWTIVLAMIACLGALIPVIQIVQKRIVKGDEGSAESRTHLTAIAIETIAKNPIFGYGSGNCHLACLPVANSSTYRSEWYYTIHCKYLLVWIETGIIGLIAFLLVLFNGLRYGLVSWFQRRPSLSPLGLGCTAAIVGHMIHMIVDIFNSRPQVQTLWVVLGVSAAIYRLSIEPTALRKRMRPSHG